MKICVFSDIHGNGPAFRVAYDMIISEKADLNIFLGDLCGYYFDQQQIFEMVLSLPSLIALQGNHDQILLRVVQGDECLRKDYHRKYGGSLEYFLKNDNMDMRLWLSALPESYSFPTFGLMCHHGSPWDPMEGYVYPDSPLEKFLDYTASLFIIGHTHYPMVRMINDKLIVNPGSLGQPRHGGWPSYAIITYPAKQIEFREVHYDKAELIKRLEEVGDNNPYLKNIMFR